MGRYYDIIRSAMAILGYKESKKPTIRFYNHISNPDRKKNILIVKPTAPTAKHFAIDPWGYANDSQIAYEEPDWMNPFDYTMNIRDNRAYVKNLITNKANKWDDSILLKWRKPKKEIPDDYVLIIGQMPNDETVKGFGFGSHLGKINDIAFRLKSIGQPFIIKLHPSYKATSKWERSLLNRWKKFDFDVRTGYQSIHDYLKKAKVAIVDNSTAGIECLMHEVPLISYGWPEYHWATARLQTLPQLEYLVSDLSWHQPIRAKMFCEWYINHYLCTDINSTIRRLKEIL